MSCKPLSAQKKKVWLWIAVNSHQAGILKWVVGDRSLDTFRQLWWVIRGWCCLLYITDGYPVYPCLIDECDHLASKTAMTRVEGENSRLRHYLARVAPQDLLLLQVTNDVGIIHPVVDLLSQALVCADSCLNHLSLVQRH